MSDLPIPMLRGARTERRPTLWLCTHCGYTYWSHDDDQDPVFALIESEIVPMPRHCGIGTWVADEAAITKIATRRL